MQRPPAAAMCLALAACGHRSSDEHAPPLDAIVAPIDPVESGSARPPPPAPLPPLAPETLPPTEMFVVATGPVGVLAGAGGGVLIGEMRDWERTTLPKLLANRPDALPEGPEPRRFKAPLSRILRRDGEELARIAELWSGLSGEEMNFMPRIDGRYPDQLVARSGLELYRSQFNGSRWCSVGSGARKTSDCAGGWAAEARLDTQLKATIPREELGTDCVPPDLQADALRSARADDGTIVIVIATCRASYAGVLLPGEANALTSRLPDRIGSVPPAVAVVSAHEAYAGGVDVSHKGYLARFDGHAWSRESTGPSELGALAATADGTLWAIAGDGILRRERGGAFVPLRLPKEAEGANLDALVANDAGEAWVTATPPRKPGSPSSPMLLVSQRPSKVVDLSAAPD